MGFLKKIFKGKEGQSEKFSDSMESSLKVREENIEGSIEESCQQIVESMKRLEEIKIEYHVVTSYLTDIQKIDNMLPEEREEIGSIARKIITHTRDRSNHQLTTKNIDDTHIKIISGYEGTILKELRQMQEYEIYQNKIETDMKHLEGEKASLYYQKADLENSQDNLRKIGIITGTMSLVLFAIFALVEGRFHIKTTIPFLMTVVLTLFVAIYIFLETGKNRKEIRLLEAKQNRAIFLLNKVKIKYVNNTNALEYSYQKFMVKSYSQLAYLYEQYKKAKEAERKYLESSQLLERTNKELIRILRKYKLEDPDIWVHQAIAIIDDKEMVEVRHRLNTRRQKLRENMDYNENLKEEGIKSVKKYLDKRPVEKERIEPLLRKYGIYI